ncbi:hypothetical protein [Francisella sp. Scap27]|uniref:hypothetical protein n=1 Tax=Francisella sp. Scap27 TaxID=2589986 RepID=UPI0015C1C5CB|nr:hypothetical protein [Francisella sp. Scap27]
MLKNIMEALYLLVPAKIKLARVLKKIKKIIFSPFVCHCFYVEYYQLIIAICKTEKNDISYNIFLC